MRVMEEIKIKRVLKIKNEVSRGDLVSKGVGKRRE